MMKTTTLFLKNGFRYTGQIIGETEEKLIIDDIKIGRTEISKDVIAIRNDKEGMT